MADVNCGETTLEDTGELKTFERNKYFYGKLMTVRDFETEQRYMNGKRYLANRLIHGTGLVCGLEVSEPAIVSGKLRVKINPGAALDCCGHEIVVESGATYDVDGNPVDGVNYLYLKYHECQKEPVPALSNPSSCEEVCCNSRIKEDFKLEVTQAAPPAATSFDWKQVWQTRKTEIQAVAAKLGLPAPTNEIDARLIITADEFYKNASCPACDDARVLLAVISVSSGTPTVDDDDTLALRTPVYSNPMLHELLRSHLDDIDNPHQTTAEQVKALMSVNNVGNSPTRTTWVQNVDIASGDGTITVTPNIPGKKIDLKTDHSQVNPLEVDPSQTDTARDKHVSDADANRWNKSIISVDGVANPGGNVDIASADGTITVTPNAAAKSIDLKTDHSQVNPVAVDPSLTDATRDKHLANADANRWNKSIASVDGLGNPGGDIALLAGTGITIDHPAVTSGPPQIRISAQAQGTTDSTTGVISIKVPKAIAPLEVTRVVAATPGYIMSEPIPHELKVKVPPSVALGLVTETGIVMEHDFLSQVQNLRMLAEVFKMPPPPLVYFAAVGLDEEKFNIVAINLDTQNEVTLVIRWWAMTARQTKEIVINKMVDAIKATYGDTIYKTIAEERNISTDQATGVVRYMVEAVSADPKINPADLALAVNLKAETVQPLISIMTGGLKAPGPLGKVAPKRPRTRR